MLTKGVILLHDNTWPHIAACANALIKLFNWEIFDHPPYSPDLVPSNYHLFTMMKVWLATQHFHTNKELMDVVNIWLHNLTVPFFEEGLQELVSQYDKCLNVDDSMTSALMWMTTMWRRNAFMYVTVPYNKVLFSIFYFFNHYATGFKWLQSTFAYDIIFARHLNFSTWFTKNFIIPGTKKDLIMD